VYAVAHVRSFAENAQHVRSHDSTAHLPDGFERVFDFEFIRPAPRIGPRELVRVLDHHQVRDVERNESEGTIAIEQLVATPCDEVIDFITRGRRLRWAGGCNEQQVE
jgi:hypothetical protein